MRLMLGLFIMTIGDDRGLFFKLGYMLFVLLGGVGIWKYNQLAAEKKFEPLLDELREAIEVIEDQPEYDF